MSRSLVLGAVVVVATAAVVVSTVFSADVSSKQSGIVASVASSQEPPGAGAMRNAEAIAKAFGMETQQVLDLHREGVGFGAIVKLLVLAKAKGTSPAALINAAPLVNGEREFDFGAQFNSLTPQQRAEAEKLGIKNLGQLKSKGKRGP